jgi:hypothetical protein
MNSESPCKNISLVIQHFRRVKKEDMAAGSAGNPYHTLIDQVRYARYHIHGGHLAHVIAEDVEA